MKNTRTILTKTLATAALAASLVGISGGVAQARPSIGALQGDCQSLSGGKWVADYLSASGSQPRMLVGYTCFYNVSGTQYKDHMNNVGDFQSAWMRQGGKWVRFE